VRELVSVAPDGAELFVEGRVVRLAGLAPERAYEVDGVSFRTTDDLGEVLCTFATANDVHFGETVCGQLGDETAFEVFRTPEGSTPYPEVMNAAVVTDMAAIEPDCVVVKGDLTDDGEDEDYARFLEVWGDAFGDRLVHVRGNHDCYRGQAYAAWPWQARVLEGVTLALLDTSRPRTPAGDLDADQLAWLDELGATTDRPVVVLGHHQVFDPERDGRDRGFQGLAPAASAALVETLARRPALCAYLCGHTHRNRRQWLGGRPCVEVACVKDFPGGWAEYRVCERGIAQVFHRAAAPAAIAWAETTRGMFAGLYAGYAMGRLEDRSFVIGTDLARRAVPST